MKVSILNFSARNNGNCANLANYLTRKYEQTNVSVFSINVQLASCSNCNYECLKAGAVCPNVSEYQSRIMDSVLTSDVAYYIVPNYCGMPCANYYAFNERAVGYFNMDRSKMRAFMDVKKRFIIISNTETELFVSAMRQQTSEEPDILYLKTGKYGKHSIAGDILESGDARADLETWLGCV